LFVGTKDTEKSVKMSQINSFRKSGIRPCQMYGAFVNNSGGYEKVGFRRNDLYNQVGRQRRQ